MAQTGYTPILIYASTTSSNVPAAGNLTNSALGSELAINITDGKLFYKDNANVVQVIGWKTTPTTAGGTGLTSYTAGDLLYYASGTTFSKLAIGASTTILTSSGTAPQWSTASSVAVGTATNIAGGAAGSVPYQTGAGATSLLAIGTAYYMLGVNAGGTAPSWQPSSTSTLTAQGDLLYASAANTLARLAKNTTASRYLSNGGTNNNPSWAQIDLTNGVTGTLPVGNGGTGTATAFTAGSVLFAGASGVYSQNNANFFWDNTNKRLGLGTASPATWLHIYTGADSTTDFEAIRLVNAGENGTYINFYNAFGPIARITATKVGGGSSADEGKLIFSTATNSALATGMTLNYNGDLAVVGALSKGSGSFKIDHPIPAMKDTHHLVHSFVEAPQADLYYRGKVQLIDGKAAVNIDQAAGMTDGTFVLLCRDVQCFTSNESDWDAVKGSVSGNILTIECQNPQSTAFVSWLVVGERKDDHMMKTPWTDENGKVIVEPLKVDDEINAKENV